MAIYYTGSASAVANIKQTPGAITDTFANRPAATAVTQYTLFFASDTGAIYQSSGGSWLQMGGGGGSQTIQQVIDNGNIISDNNDTIKLTGTEFSFTAENIVDGIYGVLRYINDISTNDKKVILGDSTGIFGNYLQFDHSNGSFYTYFNNVFTGISINPGLSLYSFGNFSNTTLDLGIYLQIYEGNNEAYFLVGDGTTSVINGFYCNFASCLVKIGDIANLKNACVFGVDDSNTTLIADGVSVGTHGSVASTHLKVKVNGLDYVIQLRNP